MAVTREQFARQLVDASLMSADQIEAFLAALPTDRRPHDASQLARELVRAGRITAYQARLVYAGHEKSLVLGNYVLLDKLGQGGMGMVYKAEHRRMERIVALKVLSPQVTKTPEALRRFQREVKAAARLVHPNIVIAYDADEVGETHFLVMEYVEGSDLASLVRTQGALSVPRAVHCVHQAARGLEYAHQQGIIHRDIKPGNLLLDRAGVVKVLDMGLARFDSAGVPQDDLTGTNQIMGTVDYMAPEQAVNTRDADHRADIYSLGVTLWYLLSGRPLYEGETVVEKLLAHQSGPIPLLRSAVEAARTSPVDSPNLRWDELDRVFQRMVAKSPEARYQSMTEVIAALSRCSGGETEDLATSPFPGENSSVREVLLVATGAGSIARTAAPGAQVQPTVTADYEQTVSMSFSSSDTDPTTESGLSAAFQHSRRGLAGNRRLFAGWRSWAALLGSLMLAAGIAVVAHINSSRQNSDQPATDAPGTIASEHDSPPDASSADSDESASSSAAALSDSPGTVFLDDLPEREWKGFRRLGKHGESAQPDGPQLVWRGQVPQHALFTHPKKADGAEVAYDLNGRFERFRATVGLADSVADRSSVPLTFRVLGDGKVLWTSGVIQRRGDARNVNLSVRGVNELRLNVLCPGFNGSAHAVWINPRLEK